MSAGPDLVSRSCPLRAFGSVLPGLSYAPDASGLKPSPAACQRTRDWPAGATRADAPSRTPHSTPSPPRTARKRPASCRTRDNARIDRPRAAVPAWSGWTPGLSLGMLPRGGPVPAVTTKARVARPGPSPSPAAASTASPQPPTSFRVAVGTALHRHVDRLGPPPARIPAGGTTALGSYRGCERQSDRPARDAGCGHAGSNAARVRSFEIASSGHVDFAAAGPDASDA